MIWCASNLIEVLLQANDGIPFALEEKSRFLVIHFIVTIFFFVTRTLTTIQYVPLFLNIKSDGLSESLLKLSHVAR